MSVGKGMGQLHGILLAPASARSLLPLSAEAHCPRMCLSGGGKQTINHSSSDGSWVRAMTMAAPPAPLAKGNKQGTGMLALLPRDAIRLQCCLSSQGAGQLQCALISNTVV